MGMPSGNYLKFRVNNIVSFQLYYIINWYNCFSFNQRVYTSIPTHYTNEVNCVFNTAFL